VSPVDTIIAANDIRNNNQGANGAGANSVGIAVESAADSVQIIGNRVTDDQGSPTQTHAIHWLSATRGRIMHNDFRGNLTGPQSATFDSKTVYEGNIEFDADYEGSATLVGGTVTVNTAAARNAGAANWQMIQLQVITPGGTQGALFVSAIVSGTSFTIKSTSATDTSTVKWRIR
jgi:hypothetical protein